VRTIGVLVGRTVRLVTPVEVDSETMTTPDVVESVTWTTLEVGISSTVDELIVTSTKEVVGIGTSEDVNGVGATLERTLAKEEATDAADPVPVAALLKTDCRLEIADATDEALLSGVSEVIVAVSMDAEDVTIGRTEVVVSKSRLVDVATGNIDELVRSVSIGVDVARAELDETATSEADEVTAGTSEEVESGETEVLDSTTTSLVLEASVTTAELEDGKSVIAADDVRTSSVVVDTLACTDAVGAAVGVTSVLLIVDSSIVLVADCREDTALAMEESKEAAELALAESVVVEAAGASTAVVLVATEALEKIDESCNIADTLALSVVVDAGTSEDVATSVGRTLEEVKSVMTGAGVVVEL
jgi:hypothetical protein